MHVLGLMEVVSFLGRLAFGGYFALAGLQHFTSLDEMASFAASRKVPLPKLAVAGAGALILVGGALVMVGWRVDWGVWLIVLFLVPVTLMMHNFWTMDDPAERRSELANFKRNVALTGAALMIASIPYWPISLQDPVPVTEPGTAIVEAIGQP